jgi:NADH dehydrogenase
MLPDILGGWARPGSLRADLGSICGNNGCEFLKSRIDRIDRGSRSLETDTGTIPYEYLVIATGSETNFYGNHSLRRKCLKLDGVEDAVRIKRAIFSNTSSRENLNVVIAGGGYTGVEAALNIDMALRNSGRPHRVHIVEKKKDILSGLSGWTRDPALKELKDKGIRILTENGIEEYDGANAVLSSSEKISDALCVWAAGVRTPAHIAEGDFETERSRIKVDETLRPLTSGGNREYVSGDTASFYGRGDHPLRMAVMFAMGQGRTAAKNILADIKGEKLTAYNDIDLGFLLPLAYGKASGKVLGLKVKGAAGYIMHYLMCVYRSEPVNRRKVIEDLFRRAGSEQKRRYHEQ